MTKLVAFDGDDTLWEPLDGVNLSDRTPTDDIGRPDFSYAPSPSDARLVLRDDGARFALRPEAAEVLAELKRRGTLLGVVSYNHLGNVQRILRAFGILSEIDYVVAEWHTDKGSMLGKMLAMARRDGRRLELGDLTLVDDDPARIYGAQCRRLGVGFACFGVDIQSLREVTALPASDSASSPSPTAGLEG